MRVFEEKEKCSGCTACKYVCPVGAILMVADEEGFLYPEVDEEKCIQCGLCRKTCPFHDEYERGGNFETPLVYAVKHVDENVRKASTSGGMFTALSDYVLMQDGVVYGAAFTSDFRVCHTKAENSKDRDALRGSKYVQSDLGNVFPEIKEILEEEGEVLFSGTPCQTAGLRAYLKGKSYPNLITCDLVCHGTPSPLLWLEYVRLLEEKHVSRLEKFNFREKSLGWHSSRAYATFDDGAVEYETPLLKGFDSLFYQHIALRPSCHKCPFTNLSRPSDVTIADFWGIEKFKPDFDDNKGVSLLLINSPKGNAVFEEIKDMLIYELSSVDECKQGQNHLKKPASQSPKRALFWSDFQKKGIEFVLKKYTHPTIFSRIKQKIIKPILVKSGLYKIITKGPVA